MTQDDRQPGKAPEEESTPRDAGEPAARSVAAVRGKPCPICSRPSEAAHRPFCSRRCADIDLGRWLKEDYRVPAVEPPDPGEDIPHEHPADAEETDRGR